jgi:hypothetical protein
MFLYNYFLQAAKSRLYFLKDLGLNLTLQFGIKTCDLEENGHKGLCYDDGRYQYGVVV